MYDEDGYFLKWVPMDWINTALLSAAIFGTVNILDSHLLTKRMPGLRSFLLPVAIAHVLVGLILSYRFPLPADISPFLLFATIGAGTLRTASVTIMLFILKREEVSRVVPLVYTYPIFVAIMAIPLLGESLYFLGWLAIFIVVVGAIIISSQQSATSSANRLGKSFFLLFGASLLMAMADITSKFALNYVSFWSLFWVNALIMSIVFFAVSLRPAVIKRIINMKQKTRAFAFMGLNEILAPGAILLSLRAIERGPVSLVATITSTRPVFVVIFALILSRIAPSFLDYRPGRGGPALRLIATAMIVGGITIIHLV